MSIEVQAESPSRDQLEAGEVIACRYRVEALRRDHPLGELYRCVDDETGALVSLQRLRREFAGEEVRGRLFETRGSAAIESEAIADLLDYGEDLDGRPFLVTSWREEPSLEQVERPLAFREAVAIVERVAEALAPLHAGRLVHGAIEPASVLVDDERELVSLLAFGLAPALCAGAQKSRSLSLWALPAYAAPELIRGEAPSPASDVYALGIVLWELIFGAVPFAGPTLRVLNCHLHRPLPEIELPFDAPASFGWILRRMLAKSPVDRFADAGVVAEQLRVYSLAPPARALGALDAVDLAGELDAGRTDELDTIVYSRAQAERELSVVLRPSAAGPREVPSRTQTISRRRGSWRFAALAAASCASLLALGSALVAGHGAAARERGASAPAFAALARAIEDRPRLEARLGTRLATPALAVPAPPELGVAPELAVELGDQEFRAVKGELYRRVQSRCVDGRMRRTVKVAVRANGAGEVEAARVRGDLAATKIGRCVRAQASKLKLPASEVGGSYVYTLRLR